MAATRVAPLSIGESILSSVASDVLSRRTVSAAAFAFSHGRVAYGPTQSLNKLCCKVIALKVRDVYALAKHDCAFPMIGRHDYVRHRLPPYDLWTGRTVAALVSAAVKIS